MTWKILFGVTLGGCVHVRVRICERQNNQFIEIKVSDSEVIPSACQSSLDVCPGLHVCVGMCENVRKREWGVCVWECTGVGDSNNEYHVVHKQSVHSPVTKKEKAHQSWRLRRTK